MNAIVMAFQMTLFNDLRAKVPIDTGNMLAHITHNMVSENEAIVTVSAPMSARNGMVSKRTGKSVTSKSDYDYAKAVNYSSKSPHQFWVEHRIKNTANVIKSNVNYGLYNKE